MNADKAQQILRSTIQPDGSLYCLGSYISWSPTDAEVVLDSRFTIEELEAIIWWIRNNSKRMYSESETNHQHHDQQIPLHPLRQP